MMSIETKICDIDQLPMTGFIGVIDEPTEGPDDHPPVSAAMSPEIDLQMKSTSRGRAQLTSDQKELVLIGQRLGLRNQDYAIALNIGLPRLSSYIYGRTQGVDPEIMARARDLLSKSSAQSEALHKRFSKKMSEILDDWSQRLGAETNDELAYSLGVAPMTIHRWRKDNTLPDLTALARYDQAVTQFERKVERAIQRRLEQMNLKQNEPQSA